MTSPSESSKHPLDARQADNKITTAQREQRNGHRGLVIWLTGLSGAGKTTIATELERQLFADGKHTYLMDGDILRHGLCSDLNFSAESRRENIRRAGEVERLDQVVSAREKEREMSAFKQRYLARKILEKCQNATRQVPEEKKDISTEEKWRREIFQRKENERKRNI